MRPVRAAGVALVVLLLLALPAPARAEDLAPDPAATDLVLHQLAALRAHNFTEAYECVSTELRKLFTRNEFEWMVKRAHPEVASSTYAFVVRTHEAAGFLYVTVKVQGRNGQNAEALYEMVREKGQWKVNALSSRRDDGVL